MQKSLNELADMVNGELIGNPDVRISGAADIQDAKDGMIVFAESQRLLDEAIGSKASAVVTFASAERQSKPLIRVQNPRHAFAQILTIYAPHKERPEGISPDCTVGVGSVIGDNPSIGRNVQIGQSVTIGKNVFIYPFVYVGDNVRIGDDCILYPFTTVFDSVQIGNSVTIHSGTVIGADGFGYTRVADKHVKIPQIGTVVIGDDVEIGANCTIDRARTGKTIIGRGTKIDNLVHVAHNVHIGENCIIVGQVGISGSVQIGDRVLLAGQVGVVDHAIIGNDAMVGARAVVSGEIAPGSFVSGFPIRDHKEQIRIQAAQAKLPALLKTIRNLEKRVKDLEDQVE